MDKVKMTVTGVIVLDKEKGLLQTKREMVAKGWADNVDSVTDSMLERYVAECNEQTLNHKPVRLR